MAKKISSYLPRVKTCQKVALPPDFGRKKAYLLFHAFQLHKKTSFMLQKK
jgi:hypothetical protein